MVGALLSSDSQCAGGNLAKGNYTESTAYARNTRSVIELEIKQAAS